jgi:hypothetical protein
MHQRTPIVLSCVAIVVAVLGTTPLGQAAGERLSAVVPPFAKKAGFATSAGNAAKLNGHRSTLSGARGTIPVVGKNGKLPAGIGAVGPQGPAGPPGPAGSGVSGGGAPSGPAGGALTGSYPNPRIAPNSIDGVQIANDSLTGADINEATLQTGLGRTGQASACDPESGAFVTCAAVPLTLATKTRVLVIGRAVATPESGASFGHGICRLGTSATGPLPDNGVFLGENGGTGNTDSATLVGVTPPIGPGAVAFGIDCNQGVGGAIRYLNTSVTALAISPA